jgi:hypothetical protein
MKSIPRSLSSFGGLNKIALAESNFRPGKWNIMNTSNKRINMRSLLLGLLLGAATVFCVAAATSAGGHRGWEYKTVAGQVLGNETPLGQAINASVAEGWEFVSASSSVERWGFAVLRREKK